MSAISNQNTIAGYLRLVPTAEFDEERPLAKWHPLIAGDQQAMEEGGMLLATGPSPTLLQRLMLILSYASKQATVSKIYRLGKIGSQKFVLGCSERARDQHLERRAA